jgi:hypothetical protein
VLSGFIALVVGIVTSFGFGVLLTWNVPASVHLLLERWWPWSLVGAFMAAATAYNIDNDEWSGLRWFEAALQAAVSAGGALIVYLQLKGLCTGTSDPDCVVPSPVRVILTAAVAGGLIGALVPTWYRKPQTMTVDYKQCKVIVTVKVLPNRPVVPTILIQRHGFDAQASPLPLEEEFLSAEEALARAVVYARRQIDVDSTVDVD